MGAEMKEKDKQAQLDLADSTNDSEILRGIVHYLAENMDSEYQRGIQKGIDEIEAEIQDLRGKSNAYDQSKVDATLITLVKLQSELQSKL